MARISEDAKSRNEAALRAAMDRLLRGELPPGGKCDLKTLAAEAGVTRTGFYPKANRDGSTRPGPYQHLAEEFERRLKTLQATGEVVNPRDAQIERLKTEVAELKERVTRRDAELAELKEFKVKAVSRLAAQHAEILQLRARAASGGNVTSLPDRRRTGPGAGDSSD
jgi:DNA repair exonuclease SbcCD ATPase subunit